MFKLFVNAAITIAIGSLFVFSAWKKMSPIDLFQFRLAEDGLCSWECSAVVMRLLIIWELFLGLLLISHTALLRFTYWAVLFTCIAFLAYLIYLYARVGPNADCGCFGEHFNMNPLTAGIKNLLIIGLIGYLKKLRHNMFHVYPKVLVALALLGSTGFVFGLRPITLASTYDLDPFPKTLKWDTLWTSKNAYPKPDTSIKQGKTIIAFFSLTCHHCLEAAYKLQVLKKQFPKYPIFMVLGGRKHRLSGFLSRTKSSHVPYTLFEDDYFFTLCNGSVPKILLCKDLKVVSMLRKYELDREHVQTFFNP